MYCLSPFCCVCLTSSKELQSLNKTDVDDVPLLSKLIFLVYGHERIDIEISKSICNECLQILRLAYKFKKACICSTDLIRGYMSQLKYYYGSVDTYTDATVTLTRVELQELQQGNKRKRRKTEEKEVVEKPLQEGAPPEKPSPENKLVNVAKSLLYKCRICNARFVNHFSLNGHLACHSDKKRVKKKVNFCGHCKRHFATSEGLNIHLACSCADLKFECNICQKKFNNREVLISHKTSQHGEKFVIFCYFCDKTYQGQDHYRRHLKTRHGLENFQCDICRKKFPTEVRFSLHLRKHKIVKYHPCEFCERVYPREDYVKLHKAFHQPDKNRKESYRCTGCIFEFSSKGHFNTHKCENFQKLNRCNFCDKVYGQKGHLKRHLLEYHAALNSPEKVTRGLVNYPETQPVPYSPKKAPKGPLKRSGTLSAPCSPKKSAKGPVNRSVLSRKKTVIKRLQSLQNIPEADDQAFISSTDVVSSSCAASEVETSDLIIDIKAETSFEVKEELSTDFYNQFLNLSTSPRVNNPFSRLQAERENAPSGFQTPEMENSVIDITGQELQTSSSETSPNKVHIKLETSDSPSSMVLTGILSDDEVERLSPNADTEERVVAELRDNWSRITENWGATPRRNSLGPNEKSSKSAEEGPHFSVENVRSIASETGEIWSENPQCGTSSLKIRSVAKKSTTMRRKPTIVGKKSTSVAAKSTNAPRNILAREKMSRNNMSSFSAENYIPPEIESLGLIRAQPKNGENLGDFSERTTVEKSFRRTRSKSFCLSKEVLRNSDNTSPDISDKNTYNAPPKILEPGSTNRENLADSSRNTGVGGSFSLAKEAPNNSKSRTSEFCNEISFIAKSGQKNPEILADSSRNATPTRTLRSRSKSFSFARQVPNSLETFPPSFSPEKSSSVTLKVVESRQKNGENMADFSQTLTAATRLRSVRKHPWRIEESNCPENSDVLTSTKNTAGDPLEPEKNSETAEDPVRLPLIGRFRMTRENSWILVGKKPEKTTRDIEATAVENGRKTAGNLPVTAKHSQITRKNSCNAFEKELSGILHDENPQNVETTEENSEQEVDVESFSEAVVVGNHSETQTVNQNTTGIFQNSSETPKDPLLLSRLESRQRRASTGAVQDFEPSKSSENITTTQNTFSIGNIRSALQKCLNQSPTTKESASKSLGAVSGGRFLDVETEDRHSSEKLTHFKCELCDKGFALESLLRAHLLIHGYIVCKNCGLVLPSKSDWVDHACDCTQNVVQTAIIEG